MLRYTKKSLIVLASLIVGTFFVYALARAQVSVDLPTSFAGFGTQDIKVIIENIVRIVLGFVGIVFIVLVLYGGLVWMTSAGQEDKITRAKKILVSATIGLVLTLAAYAIASLIIRSFTTSTGGGGGAGPGGGGLPGGIALGAGALESHYPGRNATDVPRNTNLFITWKERIQVDTMCPGASAGIPRPLAVAAVEISDVNSVVPTGDANNAGPDNILEGVVCAPTDASGKTFKFDPPSLLGTSNGNALYRVRLSDRIKTDTGRTALPLGYSWQFTVSTIVDSTPPKVLNVYPAAGTTEARNSIVQINFSEAVDPSLASGIAPAFANITLTAPAPVGQLVGSYISGNQYRTTEFFTNELCGQNSCGGDVYCLPAPAAAPPAILQIDGVVSSAITDMAGNNLDGDGDGAAGGNYTWSFRTNNTIDLVAPTMTRRSPAAGASDADISAAIEMQFDKYLSATSLTSSNVGFGRTVPYAPPGPAPVTPEINYWVGKIDEDVNGDGIPEFTKILLHHDAFKPLTPYHPGADSEVKDIHQNCFYPTTCGPGPC